MNSFLPDPETERPVGLFSEKIFFLGDEVKLAMSLPFFPLIGRGRRLKTRDSRDYQDGWTVRLRKNIKNLTESSE
jgi:hypothetical protein